MTDYFYCAICGKEVYYENCVQINSIYDQVILRVHKGCMTSMKDWTRIIGMLRGDTNDI